MRGKKYCVLLKIPNGELDFEGKIEEVQEFLKQNIKDHYHLDLKITKHMIYNNVHRPASTNKLFRSICAIQPS